MPALEESTMSYHDDDRSCYDYEPRHSYKYHCGDRTCGASDCGSCRNGAAPWEEGGSEEEEMEGGFKYKTVIARKDRLSFRIKKGDTVHVASWFTYKKNGPRTGYCRSYKLVAKGPAWEVN